MSGYHSGQFPGNYEITGSSGDPAIDSATAAVQSTPEFAALVQKHRRAMGGGAYPLPPAHPTHGGPGIAYGGGPPDVVTRPLRDIREFPLGFTQTGITGTSNCNIVSQPQVVFRGERLVVPAALSAPGGSTVPQTFNITGINVGNKSQLPAATTLSCQAFTEVAVGVRLSMDTAQIAQSITIQVFNFQAYSATFSAILFGTVAQ